jgi:hypothetical protein
MNVAAEAGEAAGAERTRFTLQAATTICFADCNNKLLANCNK